MQKALLCFFLIVVSFCTGCGTSWDELNNDSKSDTSGKVSDDNTEEIKLALEEEFTKLQNSSEITQQQKTELAAIQAISDEGNYAEALVALNNFYYEYFETQQESCTYTDVDENGNESSPKIIKDCDSYEGKLFSEPDKNILSCKSTVKYFSSISANTDISNPDFTAIAGYNNKLYYLTDADGNAVTQTGRFIYGYPNESRTVYSCNGISKKNTDDYDTIRITGGTSNVLSYFTSVINSIQKNLTNAYCIRLYWNTSHSNYSYSGVYGRGIYSVDTVPIEVSSINSYDILSFTPVSVTQFVVLAQYSTTASFSETMKSKPTKNVVIKVHGTRLLDLGSHRDDNDKYVRIFNSNISSAYYQDGMDIENLRMKNFYWSGRNKEEFRNTAAKKLKDLVYSITAENLFKMENTKITFVGHSHGNSVINKAINRISLNDLSLFFGTPTEIISLNGINRSGHTQNKIKQTNFYHPNDGVAKRAWDDFIPFDDPELFPLDVAEALSLLSGVFLINQLMIKLLNLLVEHDGMLKYEGSNITNINMNISPLNISSGNNIFKTHSMSLEWSNLRRIIQMCYPQ